jgi:thiol-disulfide isomerase/thioredoxin
MPSKSSMSSSVASASNGKGYKWLFVGLLVILFVVFLIAFFRTKKEGFENGAGNVMYFFMPECGHCQKFNPEWEKLQKMVDDNRASLKLTKIDGTDDANKDLVDQYNVKGFPTIILEYGNKSTPYDGERTADAVYKWATGLVGSK